MWNLFRYSGFLRATGFQFSKFRPVSIFHGTVSGENPRLKTSPFKAKEGFLQVPGNDDMDKTGPFGLSEI